MTGALARMAPSRDGWSLAPVAGAVAVAVAGSAALAVAATGHPSLHRGLFAAGILIVLLAVSIKRPGTAVLLTAIFLPFMELLRRLLISDAGWNTYDPLIIVGPAVAIALAYRMVVFERRPLASDLLSKLVLALLVLAAAGSFNPLGGGGLAAGLAGFLYLGAPLLWFFVGRDLVDRGVARSLIMAAIAIAAGVGVYGLIQSTAGLPSWDLSWFKLTGYTALHVGNQVRPFGTFASSNEYALYLAMALNFALAMAFHGKARLALVIPFFFYALLLSSTRSALVLAVLALIVVCSMRARDLRVALLVLACGAGTAFVAVNNLGGSLEQSASESGSALVAHQVNGIVDPLNSAKSTLPVHWSLFINGVKSGFQFPVGRGTGVSGLAQKKFSHHDAAVSTEIDVSNAFVSLGVAGGLLALAIIAVALRRVAWLYLRRGDPVVLAALSLLVVAIGQWLNGGHYALTPLLWILLGWANARFVHERAAGPAGQPPPAPGRALAVRPGR